MEKVIEKFLLIPDTASVSDSYKEVLLAQLFSLKEIIKEINFNTLEFEPIGDEDDFMFPKGLSTYSMHKIRHNGKVISYIWIDRSKIKSFNTLNKGGKKYFMPVY